MDQIGAPLPLNITRWERGTASPSAFYVVCFLSLAAIRDPLLLIPTIAHAFGLSEKGQQPLPDLLKAVLRKKEALLVLDNFEQLVAAAPEVADLLLACPHLKILVTSRETLRLQSERNHVPA